MKQVIPKSMCLRILGGVLCLMATCAPAAAADDQKEETAESDARRPVDTSKFVALADPKGELIEVSLGPSMLKVLNKAITHDQPEVGTILRDLRRIDAVVATIRKDDAEKALRMITSAAIQLEKQGWERIAYVRQASQQIRVYTRPSEDVIDGLVVFVLDENENSRQLVYSFIDGPIRLDQLPMMGSLQLPGLNAIPAAVNANTAADTTDEVKEMKPEKEDES